MALRIEHRTEDGVMVLSTRASLASLATRIVGTGEELVVINQRTGSTLVKFTVPASSPPSSFGRRESGTWAAPVPHQRIRDCRAKSELAHRLQRHGLDLAWETLMNEVERRGWYVIPATPAATANQFSEASRRVVLGVGSSESHLTVDGWGSTIVEALGWAVTHAFDSVAGELP